MSLEQLDEKLAAWLHLNLYGYVDARPNGSGAQLESFTDEQIVKAIEDAGHNLAYRNYEQDIECGRAVIAAYRAQMVPTPAQLPKKPPFIGSAQEGLPERQWLMSLKDLEEYLAQHGAQRVPLTDEQIERIRLELCDMDILGCEVAKKLARRIERAHGIGADKP